MNDETTARLALPYLIAGQLQKHVTMNEALTRLDTLVQATAVSRSIAVQPPSPDDGSLYILGAAPTGADWGGRGAGDLVRFDRSTWVAVDRPEGLRLWIADEAQLVLRHAGGWVALGEVLGAVQNVARLGLNTTADAGNPFAARLNKALWTAVGTGEGGDLRMTLNKQGTSDVLSLLFQSGYGGRAELGLVGDDDLSFKVSPDGSTWREAMRIAAISGAASFPAGAGRAETTVVAAGGPYAVPAWARHIEATAVGAGGGGGSGAAGAAGASRFGGGGGGAGGVSTGHWSVADLASTLTVTIGAGGAGGTAVSSGGGVAGGDGGAVSLSSSGTVILKGYAGAGGKGGGASSGLGGAGGIGAPASNPGGDSAVTASGGGGGSLARPDASGGGGAGGGLDGSNTVRAGGAGGIGASLATPTAGGAGGSGAPGGTGISASAPRLSWAGGGGGGGGGSTTAGHGGGAGASGAGGGGGGAGVTASGAGGAGSGVLVLLTAIG